MKPRYTRIYFRQLPAEVQRDFVEQWRAGNPQRVAGWMRFVSGDYGFIMNRWDEWYVAKYG